MNIQRIAAAALVAGVLMLSMPALAQGTQVVKKFGAWTLYSHKGDPGDICFITSQPRETKPAEVERDRAYFYVSSWIQDGIRNQVSVLLGYQMEEDSEISVTIGNSEFDLFAKDDKGFVRDQTAELRLVDAMRRGSFMTVSAKTRSGTTTSDTYSLIGTTAALNAMSNGCS